MENKYTAFCVRCRKKVDVKDPKIEDRQTSRGLKRFVKGMHAECGTKVSVIIKRN